MTENRRAPRVALEPRITVLSLGVADLDRSLAFYRDGLGLETDGIVGADIPGYAVAFFKLRGNLILAIWPRESLANDAKIPVGPRSPTEFSIGHNVRSREDVDAVIELARRAGATITDPPTDRPWGGYSAYFQDPDGHLWDVAWNPQLPFDD